MSIRHWLVGKRKIVLGTVAAGVTGIAVLLSSGVATAAPTTDASKGPGAGWVSQLSCEQLDSTEAWVTNWITVIGSDATVPGSTLWVQAQLEQANAAANTKRADRMQKILDARSTHPDRWSKLLTRLEAAEARNCS